MKKTIITILLCIISLVVGYFLTLYIDNLRKGSDVSITINYEDSKEYTIPNNKKLEKDEAILEWPYIFHIENSGKNKGLYQIIIKDLDSTIKRDDLSYALYLNDIEISSNLLSKLDNNILYTGEIEGNSKEDYKLYIWSNKDYTDTDNYTYKLEFNVIKTGGPGF